MDQVISTIVDTQVVLPATDTLTVTRDGWVDVAVAAGAAIVAANPANNVTMNGMVSNSGANGIGINFGGAQLQLGAGSFLRSVSHGVQGLNDSSTIVSAGSIVAGGSGMSLIGGGAFTINVLATSHIQGTSGFFFAASGPEVDAHVLTNAGVIVGVSQAGINLSRAGATATNSGTIFGQVNGVLLVANSGTATINNTGTIRGRTDSALETFGAGLVVTNSGIIDSFGSNGITAGGAEASTIVNNGRITGHANSASAVFLGSGNDVVTNNGIMVGGAAGGAAVLGGGADTFNGQNGQQSGAVNGGLGNDTITGGAGVDLLMGGDDNDTLDGRGGVDTLDGGNGNDIFLLGADLSDTIIDASGTDTIRSTVTRSLVTLAVIETLILEGAANINGTGNGAFNSIVGNSGNNILGGQAGNDVLVGGGGNDQIFGQADKDNLTGGADNDTFGFQSVAHTAAGNGDVIVDFDDSGEDVIDLTGIPGLTTYQGINAFTAPGQVRIQQVGANIVVEINTTGNSVAEGEITILNATIGLGVGQVSGGDFLI